MTHYNVLDCFLGCDKKPLSHFPPGSDPSGSSQREKEQAM